MQVHQNSPYTFKGYDARKLKGFLMNTNCCGIADEMFNIGRKEGFKIYSATDTCYEGTPIFTLPNEAVDMWAQDYWTLVKGSLLTLKENLTTSCIRRLFNLYENPLQKQSRNSKEYKTARMNLNQSFVFNSQYRQANLELNTLNRKTHISGGNIFIVKGKNNQDEVLVGEHELKKFSLDEIKKMYFTDKVCVLPQMDYHLDLFIRPLDNKRILLADDNITLKALEKMLKTLEDKLNSPSSAQEKELIRKNHAKLEMLYLSFRKEVARNPLPKADNIAKILEENDYEVIRVPARLYNVCKNFVQKETILVPNANFLNANVTINQKGELVYITNETNIDKQFSLGISFKKAFLDALEPYVKKEHTYFINGQWDYIASEMLPRHMGGIHCACTEIPA